MLSEKETEFLPITTKAYLYLSGTPFKALATGEFIEEQIFNWTYTDEQRAKEEFAAKNEGKSEPLRGAAADASAHISNARRAPGDCECRESSMSSISTSSLRPRVEERAGSVQT